MKRNEERDKKICEEHKAGAKPLALAAKYGIGINRMYQILLKSKRPSIKAVAKEERWITDQWLAHYRLEVQAELKRINHPDTKVIPRDKYNKITGR